jgi:hypothetical protein
MNDNNEFNRRRKSRALVTAGILIGFVILIYFITIARIGG